MGRCRLVGGGGRDVVGLRLVVVVVVAALAALIVSPSESVGDRLEWGRRRLTQSSSAAAVKRRSDVDDDLRPLLWWKFRGSTRPTEQRTNLMKLLLHGVGSSLRQPSPLLQSTQWTNIDRNSLLHLIRDAPPSSSSSFSFSSSGESDPPGGSLQSENLGDVAPSPRHASEFLDAAQYFRNLGRPRSRRNPPSSRSGAYVAPHENRYSSGGDAAERRRLVFAGARRILAEPEVETTRQAMKKRRVWRRVQSLNDPPQNDDDDLLRMVSWKRQPPPGFHAIRGKRDSETEERDERDGEEEDEEDEEEEEEEDGEEREEEAINRWIRQTARRIGLDS